MATKRKQASVNKPEAPPSTPPVSLPGDVVWDEAHYEYNQREQGFMPIPGTTMYVKGVPHARAY